MLKIGAHLSSSKGFYSMGEEMLDMGANTCQFFTRNPRGGQAKEIRPSDVEKFLRLMKENDVESILAHASYTINPCSDKEETRIFALNTMIDDMKRMEWIPNQYYNFHPGSHVGQGVEQGISYICETLNHLLKPEMKTQILLETMSGKGSEIGSTFEELRQIINQTENGHLLGVCMDTCHIFSAGYDIVNKLDDVLENFDSVIGLEKLKMIHLNDSLTPFNSHKDRHAKIGEGSIGAEALVRFVNHPRLKHLSFILETPNEFDGYKKEIAFFRANYSE
ncbi:MAG: deoxyribonuclease IV [Alphaproteobacteria bacterium]|nr:deoxyribonuclease IV [Alphaproteobacteria bacterium]MBQ3117346.1 deoxyribonuclease IV [Alphaproteobacteria bacterium]MBQ6855158.1 deoxyribonuclease IV [Alphaproteobacteria bacterium]